MIIRWYFKCKAKVMEDTGMLEPIVKLPIGCNLEVLAYSSDKREALVRIRATDIPDLMTAITRGLQIKAGRELLKEFVELNSDTVRYTPYTLAEKLYEEWTGERRDFASEIEKIAKADAEGNIIEEFDSSQGGDE